MSDDVIDVSPERLPLHVAIIMDGNGRWAVGRGLPRVSGHQRGARVVTDLVAECDRIYRATGRLKYLTLYSFSLENWKRPAEEVAFLMRMYVEYLREQRPMMLERQIRFRQIGRQTNLPSEVLDEVRDTEQITRPHDGLHLTLALNYGSRAEIVDAMRAIAAKVAAGELDPGAIDETTISQNLYTADVPDPDLLVRTAGEMRLSNYLLWQISYAELFVSNTLWPDFDATTLADALRGFASRKRRFGALDAAEPAPI